MVNYLGGLMTINEDQHDDLFWALRGAGGGNFGVVTEMKFKIYPKTAPIHRYGTIKVSFYFDFLSLSTSILTCISSYSFEGVLSTFIEYFIRFYLL